MLLKLYVAAVALVATGVALAAGMTTHVGATAGVPALAIMASLLWLTEFFAVRRYNYKGHGFNLNLIEGVMAPLVIGASGTEAVVITGLAICIAETLRRVDGLK